jgi:uncharacterized membrane protein
MPWLAAVLLGHLLNAAAFVVDKVLLRAAVRQPAAYVFSIGVLNLAAFALAPWSTLASPPTHTVVQSVVSGVAFVVGLLGFFTALQRGEATRVVPLFGALVPVWTLLFAAVLLGERLNVRELWGVVALVVGAVLISYERSTARRSLDGRTALLAAAGAAAFALAATTLKSVFIDLGFLDGFLLTRVFTVAAVVPLLAWPAVRRAVGSLTHPGGGTLTPLFFFGQACGAAGFVALAWATSLAPRVAVVNALQGVQYAFLFVAVLALSRFAPRVLQEHWPPAVVAQKVAALVVLSVGLGLVA